VAWAQLTGFSSYQRVLNTVTGTFVPENCLVPWNFRSSSCGTSEDDGNYSLLWVVCDQIFAVIANAK